MSSRDVDGVESVAPTVAANGDGNIISVTSANASLFLLKPQDVEVLAQSEGFGILRDHLAETCSNELCDKHTPTQLDSLPRWLLARDVLHALLVPVVELFDKAATLACHAVHATKVEDLEYAYSGQARSAFVWLQCFLSNEKEREWCYTRGCPACVVDHSLDSEFSVRLLYAACLLSDVHYPFTLEGPTLPSFIFFLDLLEQALGQDDLYGSDFFERTQPKALAIRNGIEELIQQSVELEVALSQPTTPADTGSAASSAESSPVLGALGPKPSSGKVGMKVKRSKLARRQMNLQIEEQQWIEEMARRCVVGGTGPITGAESAPMLEDVLKTETVLTIREITSAG